MEVCWNTASESRKFEYCSSENSSLGPNPSSGDNFMPTIAISGNAQSQTETTETQSAEYGNFWWM